MILGGSHFVVSFQRSLQIRHLFWHLLLTRVTSVIFLIAIKIYIV